MKEEKIKFSIIVTVYNIEKYITKCLESILNQNYSNFELIVVNDGSTDNSENICKTFEKKDNRIKYIYKDNGGISSTRNTGMKNMTGQYMWFIDGDDYIPENALEIMSKEIENNDYDIVYFENFVVRNNKIIKPNPKQYNMDLDKRFLLSQPSPCNKIFKTEFLIKHKVSFPIGIIYEDLAIIPALCIYTKNIKFLNEYLYYYVIRDNSIMHIKKFNSNRDDKFMALDELIKSFVDNNKIDKYHNEVEFIIIKHILIMYAIEIIVYKKSIYEHRIERALKYIEENFPNWKNNEYFKAQSFVIRLFCKKLKEHRYFIGKLIVITAKILKKID